MKDHEEIMREWDAARSIIARGDTSSRPRDWFENVISEKDARITELQAALSALYGIVYGGLPEHASERRRELERGIGAETESGRAWLAAFSALGVPVKRKL